MVESDDLGQLGENAFHNVCIRQSLKWSKPSPDRTGKDCIIEWRPRHDGTPDTRRIIRRCHVQVKTTRITKSNIKIKLSAFDWLVKDLTPCFIVTPVFDTNDDPNHFVIFHIWGSLMERALKKLRQAGVQKKNLNEMYVSIALSTGIRCDSDIEVRQQLERLCGDDTIAYAAQKDHDLRNLGYDDLGPEFKVQFAVNDESEIVDCLMGEKSLAANLGTPTRRRFGIEAIDYDSKLQAGPITFSVIPEYSEVWTLRTHQKEIDLPARSIVIDGLPAEHWRAEATNGIIKFTTALNDTRLSFKTDILRSESIDPTKLLNSMLFWKDCIEHPELQVTKQSSLSPLHLTLKGNLPDQFEWLNDAIDALTAGLNIYEYCMIEPTPLNLSEVLERKSELTSLATAISAEGFRQASYTISGPTEQLDQLELNLEKNALLLLTTPAIVGSDVMAVAVAYTVSYVREGNSCVLKPESRLPLRSIRLTDDDLVNSYRDFSESTASATMPACRAHHELAIES